MKNYPEMVGTTRPRIGLFMQRFRHLGLIETNQDRFLVIKEHKLDRLSGPDRMRSRLLSSKQGAEPEDPALKHYP